MAVKTLSAATDRALTVLEVLSREPEPMTLTRIAAESRIPIATCASILYTLEERGYASRSVVGRSHFWSLTLALYSVASQQVQKLNFATIAQRDLVVLAREVGLPAHIGIISGAKLVYVAKETGPSFIQFDTHPGKVVPFNLTALGRAIAAYLPEEKLADLLHHLATGAGPNAVAPEESVFRAQLDAVRSAGYAIEDQEEVQGVACIASAFFDASSAVAGAVGITGISDVLVGDFRESVVDQLQAAARSITEKLGGRMPPTGSAGPSGP